MELISNNIVVEQCPECKRIEYHVFLTREGWRKYNLPVGACTECGCTEREFAVSGDEDFLDYMYAEKGIG